MSIFAECPVCRTKQSVKNKKCTACAKNLDQAKDSGSVRYWIDYYLPSGKRKRELVGNSIKDAVAAQGKMKAAKKENRLFDVLPESKMTFLQLTHWYLEQAHVKSLASYDIIKVYLKKFNSEFGDMIVEKIKPSDLENLIAKRKRQKCADATIDHEIVTARTMIIKAHTENIVGLETVNKIRKIKKLVKGNANARSRIISPDEFADMIQNAPQHLRPILIMAYHTGMRKGEILNLTWDKVDMKKRLIHLEAKDTKDREKRSIPIFDELHKTLNAIPKAIHDKHVFLYKGKPINDIRSGLKNACSDAGVSYGRSKKKGFVFHDLRHTFNTNMRKAGIQESVIMKITGHSTRSMFDRYNTINEKDLEVVREKMDAAQ